ncbi:hypothetical protein ACFYTQ_28125 [Nocardia sp. NPDC004068]|uniref:hypothetical protein n=1 Tax=Nocardia sp. NPDC004068 TaxID=3364303 RepID=UPI00367AD434
MGIEPGTQVTAPTMSGYGVVVAEASDGDHYVVVAWPDGTVAAAPAADLTRRTLRVLVDPGEYYPPGSDTPVTIEPIVGDLDIADAAYCSHVSTICPDCRHLWAADETYQILDPWPQDWPAA